MKETYEFQLFAKYVPDVLGADNAEISRSPSQVATIVRGRVGDEQYRRIESLERKLRETTGAIAVAGWDIRREYSSAEFDKAELLLLKLRFAHMAGDEYGTEYADPETISACGLGSRQIGPLRLPVRKMLKSHDMFMVWSGETIASPRIAATLHGAEGGRLQPIAQPLARRKVQDGEFSTGGFQQLIVSSSPLVVQDQSEFGGSPFRRESAERCKCALGEIRGSRLLTPLSVARSSWDGADICATDVFVGSRGGFFRPYRLLVISKRLFEEMLRQGARGLRFEIVELV